MEQAGGLAAEPPRRKVKKGPKRPPNFDETALWDGFKTQSQGEHRVTFLTLLCDLCDSVFQNKKRR